MYATGASIRLITDGTWQVSCTAPILKQQELIRNIKAGAPPKVCWPQLP